MYIGMLNDKLHAIRTQITTTRGSEVPLKEAGDPFRGERLWVSWSALAPAGLALTFRLDGRILLNQIVLRLADKSEPSCISLYTEDKKTLLDRYSGETGCAIRSKEIALSVEGEQNSFVLEIDANLSDVIIDSIELYGADLSAEEPTIYPTPTDATFGGDDIPLSKLDTVSADCESARTAVAVLTEKLGEMAEHSLKPSENGKIRLTKDSTVAAGGYRLDVGADGAEIRASDLRGFVQGVETLIKLVRDGKIPTCHIEDAPFCVFRGVHLFLPAPDQMDFCKRLIKYLLSPMGYDHIIMEIAGAMRFQHHPEINEAFLEANRRAAAGQWPPFPHGSVGGCQVVEQEAVRDLCDYARRFGIEIIPEIQSLGHVQFMTQAYPGIAERPANAPIYEDTDERLADVPPNQFYAHCYCPSNPLSYEILFDLIDEIVSVFRPRQYVHMGHDEVYQIGVCPVCAQRDPAELFAEDVVRIHRYLAEKGLRMMIWSDMLQSVTKYKTPAAISRIPKDVMLLDFIWYFHVDKDIEDNLLPHGFSVIAGNMYSSHYPRYESRIRKAGMCGAQVSAWVQTDQESLAREGKLYDFLYSAQMLWSAAYTSYARYSYDRILSAMMPRLREQLGDARYPSLGAHAEQILYRNDVLDLERADSSFALHIGARCDSLLIEHTATLPRHRLPWVPLEVIGQYEVCYEDGQCIGIPVTYGGNIHYFARRHHQPYTHQYYRHNGYSTAWETDGIEGKSEHGTPVTFYRFEWINPRPEVGIASIAYTPAEGGAEDVLVRRIVGVTE